MHAASMRPPSCERMCTVHVMEKTAVLARRHSDSVSRAEERRMVFSRSRERRDSVSVGREGSNAGEAMGERLHVIVKTPSVGRMGSGFITVAVVVTSILIFVREWFDGVEVRNIGNRALKLDAEDKPGVS